jgi:riboflavin synthase
MFTGIVEEVGKVTGISSIDGGRSLKISASKILEDINTGDSISVNGVCLTVTRYSLDGFYADAVGETLLKTTINSCRVGTVINLERAMKLNHRLGGHLVQGHVSGVGIISEIKKLGENYSLSVRLPESISRYVVPEGSIALDGISLTVAKIINSYLAVSVIPHTWRETNLHTKKTGDKINLEIDVVARYAEKLFNGSSGHINDLSEEKLIKMGY